MYVNNVEQKALSKKYPNAPDVTSRLVVVALVAFVEVAGSVGLATALALLGWNSQSTSGIP